MGETVYILCMLTSLACALLLGLGYWRTRIGLLCWSCLCFVGMAITNLLLLLDLVVFPAVDLGPYREWTALISMSVLVFGLLWDAE